MIQWTHWVLEHVSWEKEIKKFDFMLANISQAHFILQKEKCNSGISRDEQHILVVWGTGLLTLAKWM